LGEAAPLPGCSHEGLDEVARQLRHLADSMVGREATVDLEGAFARELDTLDLVPSARFGFELALWDLYAASSGKALPELVTSRPRTTVTINALIYSPDHAIEEALRARAAGYEAVKLKVGGRDVEEDVELVRAVRRTLNSDVSLRLDANRAWSFEEAERFARGIAGLRLEYVEEPLSDPAGLPSLSLAPATCRWRWTSRWRWGITITRGPSCSSRRCSAASRERCASRDSLRASGCDLS
jgi:O-succinylbenzoate synthase